MKWVYELIFLLGIIYVRTLHVLMQHLTVTKTSGKISN